MIEIICSVPWKWPQSGCTLLHGVCNLIEVISSWTEQKLRSILNYFGYWVRDMVVNVTYNNISVISLLSVLLVESLEKTINLQKLTDKHYHTMLYRVHCCIEYTRHVYLVFKYNVEGTEQLCLLCYGDSKVTCRWYFDVNDVRFILYQYSQPFIVL